MRFLAGMLTGIWRGLDALRKVLHLIVLLALFVLIASALRYGAPRLPRTAALVVRPRGQLVEQLSIDPLARAVAQARGQPIGETSLWDLVDSIRSAASDPRIKVLFLDLDDFDGADGLPPLQELADAIHAFRASGKKVIAFATTYMRDQYYLAAQADEVYLDPLGYVLIDGYGRYPIYFKNALDKLGVDVNVFRVGQYKSAVEEYTRSNMSPQDREESLGYLNALWTSYQKGVTTARHLPADAVARYVDALPQTVSAAHGATAQVALHAGLITGIATRQQIEKRLIRLVGSDDSGSTFRGIDASDYVRIAHERMNRANSARERVGVIVASGDILDGSQPPGSIGGDSLAKLIRQAREDDDIKAVVLRVDSPGGSVNASDEIYQELRALEAAGKPLVVSMGSYAASGGYYISAPAREIWASPATITGSIGIFAVVPTFGKTLSKVGITVDGIGTTPLSGLMQLTRPLTDDARTLLQSFVDHGYDEFLARVAAGRHKTTDAVNQIGQGRVWAGADAAKIGLVDHLGSFEDAVAAAAHLAKLTRYRVQFIEPQLSWAEQLVLSAQTSAVRVLMRTGLNDSITGGMGGSGAAALAAQRLGPLKQAVERLARFAAPNRLYAYCFCSAR
ncbi:MAG: signal peptide peptidase SppA [Steroidobacteraceae bacterium]